MESGQCPCFSKVPESGHHLFSLQGMGPPPVSHMIHNSLPLVPSSRLEASFLVWATLTRGCHLEGSLEAEGFRSW